MKSRFLKFRLASLALVGVFLPIAAQGATYVRNVPTGDWATLAEWNDDSVAPPAFAPSTVLPGIADTVILNQDRVTDVNTAIGAVGAVQVSNTVGGTFLSTTLNINSGGTLEPTGVLTVGAGSDTGTLNVLTGGTLTATGGISVGADPSHNLNVMGGTVTSPTGLSLAGGQFNLSSGTVTLTDPNPGGGTFNVMNGGSVGVLNITGGDFIVAGATGPTDTIAFRGEINISGGTFSALGGQAFGQAGNVWNITGDSATILTQRFNMGPVSRTATFNFNFGASGVSPITVSSYMRLGAATINVDGSSYTGGPGVIPLLTSAGSGAQQPLATAVTAPFPGLNSVISLAGNDLVVTLSLPITDWDGSGDLTWTGPSDSTSWSGATYINGDLVSFGDIGSGPVAISGTVEPGSITVNNTTSNDYVFSGDPISGAGTLTKSGDGTLTLNSANTYDGKTTVNNGILIVGNDDALGSTVGLTEVTSTGKLHVGGQTIAEDIEVIGRSGLSNIRATGGEATFTGAVDINGNGVDIRGPGTLRFAGGIGRVGATNGEFFNTVASIYEITPIDVNGFGVPSALHQLNVGGNNFGYIKMAFGNSELKIGTGLDNAWNSDTELRLGWTTAGNSKARVDLNGTSQTVAKLTQANGGVTAKEDTGELDTLNQEITGGGTLTIDGTSASLYFGRFTDGATATNVVKAGSGTLTLNNQSTTQFSTNTGSTTINAGILESKSGRDFSDFGSVVLAGGTLNLNYVGTDTIGMLDLGAGPVADGVYGSGDSAFITGGGTLTVVGPPLFWDGSTDANWTNPDFTSWSGGTYNDGDDVSFLGSGAGPINISDTVAPGSMLVDSAADYSFSGLAIGGATGLTKSGSGVLTLNSPNTYTGVTTVTGGTLTVGNNAALGDLTGNTVVNGGILRMEGGISLAEPLDITGGTKEAPALWNFAGSNTVTGAISGNGRIQTQTGTLTISGGITSTSKTLAGEIVVDTVAMTSGSIDFAGDGYAIGDPSYVGGRKIVLGPITGTHAWNTSRLFFDADVELGANDIIPTNCALAFGWSDATGAGYASTAYSKARLDLNGFNQTVAEIKASFPGVGGDVSITNSTGSGVLTVDQATDTEYQGRITGGLSLVKNGVGVLTLNNLSGTPHSHTGGTTVGAGILRLGDGTSGTDLPDAGDVIAASGAVLDLNYVGTDTIDQLSLGGALQTPGTWGSSASGATFVNNTFFTGTGTLTVSTGPAPIPYQTWSVANGLSGIDALTTADVESDGLVNLLEFGFGTDPNVPDNASLVADGSVNGSPIAVLTGGGAATFDFLYVRRDDVGASGSVTYTAQFSGDLVTFHDSTATPILVVDSTDDASYEVVKVPYPFILPDGKKARFARIKVTEVP